MQNQTSTESEASNKRSVTHNMASNFCQISKDIIADNAPKQVLPFCFVKYLRKYADPIHTIQEAVRLFEANNQPHLLQISEKITEKVFDRERLLRRLKDLKNYYVYRHNQSTEWKKNVLTHLNLALDNLSLTNKPLRGRAIKSTQEEHDNKKLNFRMLHGTRNLAEEKQLLRDMNMCQKTNEASSSPLPELIICLDQIKFKCRSYYYPYEQKNWDGLLREIKYFEETGKNSEHLKKSIRNQVKVIGDELMEMRKKKRALENKIKHVEKEIEAINEEIWSFQKHLKDKYCRKDVSLFILELDEYYYWVLKYSNLEDESIMCHSIYLKKSSSQARLATQ